MKWLRFGVFYKNARHRSGKHDFYISLCSFRSMGVSKKCKKECLGCLWGVFGGFMGSLGVTRADIGCPLGVVGGLRGGLGRLGGAMGGLKLQNTHICEASEGSGDQLTNPRRVQVGCR